MTYNIQFQIAGFSVILILIIIFFSKKRLKSFQNKIYSVLLVVTLLELAFDIISVCTIVNRAKIPEINMFFSRGYLLVMVAFVYLIDIYALANTLYEGMPEWRKKAKYITAGLLTAGMLVAVIRILTGELLFAGEGFQVYSYGTASDTVYLFSGISVGFVILVLLINCRHVSFKRQISFYSFCVMEGAVALVQMFNKELLIVGFGTAVTVMIMYFTLENPDLKMIAELERSKQEAEKAQREATEANQAKSLFLAQMSHEIRTPINAVLGMNEMILRESKDPVVAEYASNAYNAGKTLLSIINDILDISKIEAGKLEIINSDYEMYSLVSDCYHMMVDRAEKKGLQFLYTVDESLPVKLSGDMFHIRQIVVNFLTNAIKYTDAGSVELTFSGVHSEAGFALQISVKDTGIGLTEENLEKLFDSFQRFDLTRNQSVEGSGLGLSICKQLAELMGGEVSAESVYGQGSTFCCTIPQVIVDDTPVGKMVINRSAKQQGREDGRIFTAETAQILVVDDVEMNLLVFTSLLKGHKLRIDTALSGKQCLDMIQKQKYDIIFMDHMMPEMDGMETFARMGEMEHVNQDTPVVMLTANAISGEKEKYMSAGFTAYLTKPIQSNRLEETLLQYLPQEKIRWQKTEENGSAAEGEPDSVDMSDICGDRELFDVGLGIRYAGDDRDSYHKILTIYVRDGQKKAERIRQAYGQEAWKDYITEVHALKSTSLVAGSKRLSEAAAELERAGKAEDHQTIKDRNEEVLALHQRVLEIGRRVLDQLEREAGSEKTGAAGQKEELSKEQLTEYLKNIKAAADGFDRDHILALCGELSGCQYQGADLGIGTREIKEAAEEFEYELAGERAEELRMKIDIEKKAE